MPEQRPRPQRVDNLFTIDDHDATGIELTLICNMRHSGAIRQIERAKMKATGWCFAHGEPETSWYKPIPGQRGSCRIENNCDVGDAVVIRITPEEDPT